MQDLGFREWGCSRSSVKAKGFGFEVKGLGEREKGLGLGLGGLSH